VRLREGADRRRLERRKPEPLALQTSALGVGRTPPQHFGRDAGGASPDLCVPRPWRGPARGERRTNRFEPRRMSCAQRLPARGILRRDAPRLELERAARGARLVERGVLALLDGEVRRRRQRVEVDLLGDPTRKFARLGSVERQSQLEEVVLEAHETESHRTPAQVRRLGRGDG
jgi:hypothetical protein